MTTLFGDPVVGWSAAAVLAAVLGLAAAHKWRDRVRFAETLRDYRVLPEGAVRFVAPVVPVLESAIAIALLVPSTRSGAAVAAAAVLVGYAGAIGWNLARGRTHVDCGCSFGGGGQPINGWLLVRNGALIGLAGVAGGLPLTRAAGFGAVDLGVVVLAAATGLLLYLAAEQLIANQARARDAGLLS